MTSVQIYYEQPEVFDWLDAISGDNGSIDPRTLELHQVVTTHHNSRPNQPSPSEQQSSPQLSRRSSLDLRGLVPLKLEHKPPVPRVLSESSLRRLHDLISEKRAFTKFRNEDSVSLATIATDSEYERCFLPYCGALPQQSEESSVTAAASSPSPSSTTNHEPQWLPLVVVQVVSSKARKAYRAFKKKFPR
ncbi:unnamed protein product [Penicillium glandicola]